MRRKVAVVGGGITGLTAAYYVYREAEARGEGVEVTLLEGSDRLGGRVNTLRRDGFVIERGPDSFLARKLPMIRLAESLGIAGELTGTNPAAKKTYISRDGRLHAMPAGLVLGVPTDVEAFQTTALVSEEGKQQALADREIAPGEAALGDESVGAFLERHMGAEMVTRIFEPLLAGIYAGDLYGLSLQATFPQFKEMERQYGSLIAGSIEARKAAAASSSAGAASVTGTASLPASVFYTFKNGLSTVVEALEERLREYGCDIRLSSRVESLAKAEGTGYRLTLADGELVDADAVVVALPAAAMAGLLAPHTDVSALTNIRYVSVANVVLGYDSAVEGSVGTLDGSGFLVPRGEGRTITASTWTSVKWLHTAPEGKRLIRCYVGRAGDEAGVELSDEEITAAVRRDLRDLMGLEAAPSFVEITRLRHSMPQYPVGHKEAIASFVSGLEANLPGVIASGQPFGGVGLPDCVAQGQSAAERVWQQL